MIFRCSRISTTCSNRVHSVCISTAIFVLLPFWDKNNINSYDWTIHITESLCDINELNAGGAVYIYSKVIPRRKIPIGKRLSHNNSWITFIKITFSHALLKGMSLISATQIDSQSFRIECGQWIKQDVVSATHIELIYLITQLLGWPC